jgi:hypothetical protein
MVYEANPAAISHQASVWVAFTNAFWNTIDSVRYVYSLYPEAAKLKILRARQFCTMQRGAAVRKYSAYSYCPENISEKK